VAAPVFGPDGHLVLALTAYDLPAPLTGTEVEELTARVRAAAAATTVAVGGTAPTHDRT
jgi:DNA-binding IclR family transcriptional regulator